MYLSSQIPPQCLSSHIFSTYTPKHALFPNFLISLSETTLFLYQLTSAFSCFSLNHLTFPKISFFFVFIRDFQIRGRGRGRDFTLLFFFFRVFSKSFIVLFFLSKVNTLICSGAPWVRKFRYRWIQEILVLRKSSVGVRTYVHPFM